MKDLLIAVKVKNNDGTYSDSIPFGVSADNVNWDINHNLIDILGTVDLSKGDIQTQLSSMQSMLDLDATPTTGSSKPVTSGGIKAALDLMDDDISSLNEDITNLSDDFHELVVEYTKVVHPNPRQLWDKSLSPSLTDNSLHINTSTRAITSEYKARVYTIEVNGASGDQFSFNLLNSKTFADFGISSAEIYASNDYPQAGGAALQRGTASASYYRGLINLAQASKYIILDLIGSGFTDADNAKENCDAFMDNVVVRKGGYDTTYYDYSATYEYTNDYKVLPIDQGIGNAGKTLMVGSDGKVVPVDVPDVTEEIAKVNDAIEDQAAVESELRDALKTELEGEIGDLLVDYTKTVHLDPHQLWDKSLSPSLTDNSLFINTSTKAITADAKSRVYTIEVNASSGDQFSFNLLNSKTFSEYGITAAEIFASDVYPEAGKTALQRGSTSLANGRALINLAQASKYIVIELYGSSFADAATAKTNCDACMDNIVVRQGGYDTTYYDYTVTTDYDTDYKVLPINQGLSNAGKMLIVGGDGKVTVGTMVNPEASDGVGYHPLQSVFVGSNLISGNTPVTLGNNWSGSLANGLTHATGAKTDAVITISMTENKRYLFAFTLTSEFEGGLTVAFGGGSPVDVYGLALDKKIGFVSDGTGTITISAASSLGTTLSDFALYEVVENGTEIILGAKNVNHGSTGSNLTGFWNIAIGSDTTQRDNVNGSRNIAIGYEAQHMLKQGTRNVGVGTFAMPFVKEGDRNIAIGSDSLYSGSNVNSENKAYDNVAIGYASLHDGSLIQRNVAVGVRAMKDGSGDATENVVVGFQAGNYSHKYNTFVGNRAGYYNQSNFNVAVGCEAGSDMYVNGQKNIAIGAKAGIDNTGGTSSSPKTVDNTIAIGYNVKAKESNQACFGASDQTIILAGKKIVFNQDGTVTWEALT